MSTWACTKTWTSKRWRRLRREVGEVQATTSGPLYMGWGTDLWAPSQKLIENVAVLNQRLAPSQFRLATAAEYFRAAEATREIPELSGEITGSWGNLTVSMVGLWPPAMAATDTLVSAEKFAAINDALGYAPYPGQEFESLWKGALKSMDHNNDGQGGDIGDERKVGLCAGGRVERRRDSARFAAQHRRARTAPLSGEHAHRGLQPAELDARRPGENARDAVRRCRAGRYRGLQESHAPGG